MKTFIDLLDLLRGYELRNSQKARLNELWIIVKSVFFTILISFCLLILLLKIFSY